MGQQLSSYENVRRDLNIALSTIISLMPDHVQRILSSYYSCESRQDTYRWPGNVADALIELAEVLPPDKGSTFSDRADCPLCKSGSTAPYELGFSVQKVFVAI